MERNKESLWGNSTGKPAKPIRGSAFLVVAGEECDTGYAKDLFCGDTVPKLKKVPAPNEVLSMKAGG